MTDTADRSALSGFIIFLPSYSGENVPYWQVQNGAIVDRAAVQIGGSDPLLPAIGPDDRVLALVRTADTVLTWTAVGDLSPRQAETAARIAAVQKSLSAPGDVHVVAGLARNLQSGNGNLTGDANHILVASISTIALRSGLDFLAAGACDPDIVLPVGLVLTPASDGYLRAQIGEDSFLRGLHLVLPDEPDLVAALAGSAPITMANDTQIQNGLANAFADPAMNLRSGAFAKRNVRGAVAAAQWKMLAAILATGLIASLLLALITWAKYDRAIAREDAVALSAIQKIVPAATNVTEGQKSLYDALSRRGNGGTQVTSLAASVFLVLKQVPSVTLRDMRFNGDGMIAFTLAAPNVDGINQALQIMQQQGYKVTATPRQDASGVAMADIDMGAR